MGPNQSDGWSGPWAHLEPEFTEQEKALRDRFVEEYLVDFSPLNAARRVGFAAVFAEQWAKKLMGESYVRKRMEDYKHRTNIDEDTRDDYDRRRVRAQLMREAHDAFSTGSARVAALGKLMSLLDMDSPLKVDSNVTHRGGVMMVPAIAGLDEWERAAMASQQELVKQAREDIH